MIGLSGNGVETVWNATRTRAALTFAHPTGNILTAAIVADLRAALRGLRDEPALRLVTLQGAGADFSFGASVPEHAPDTIRRVLPDFHALIEDLLDCPAPTAAVVRGRCLGGGFELALACDLIFAADSATLGLPEIALGAFPPAGSLLLPLRIGTSKATRAVLTGESESAASWQVAGLVELAASADSLERRVDAWFDTHLARQSAAALRHAAQAVRYTLRERVRSALPAIESLYLESLMSHPDAAEGVTAFQEKRSPKWKA